jgi:hypothetical protein
MSRRTALAVTLLPLALVLSGCAGTEAPDEPGTGDPATTDAAQRPPETGETTTPPAEPTGTALAVDVAGGRVTGDTGRVAIPLGHPVTVTITSDVPDEAHLHGYDVTADLAAGTPADLSFDATIPGVFELELHDAGTVLLTLQIS